MQIGGQTGTGNTKTADGNVNTPIRQGGQNEMMVSELHGQLYEQTYRGNVYSVANQAAVSSTAALATTFTGLAIANPSTSGFNLVIKRFTASQFAVGAAGAIGIMCGTGAAAGSLTPVNRILNGKPSVATASAGATIATPVLYETYGSVGSLATTGYGVMPGIVADLNGSLIIPPGFYAASYTTVATTTALIFGFVWEEVPV